MIALVKEKLGYEIIFVIEYRNSHKKSNKINKKYN